MYCELIEKADLIAGEVERPGLAEDGSHPVLMVTLTREY
jgi:hypothetical protein